MSAPNASSSSSQLVSYAQDIDYTHTKGFKQFKSRYNVKNARCARNNPRGAYPSAETVYQAVKGPGCTLCSFDDLSLDDFISSGSVAACRCLKRLSLAPYYAAQMKRCTQKWDRRCCVLLGCWGECLGNDNTDPSRSSGFPNPSYHLLSSLKRYMFIYPSICLRGLFSEVHRFLCH